MSSPKRLPLTGTVGGDAVQACGQRLLHTKVLVCYHVGSSPVSHRGLLMPKGGTELNCTVILDAPNSLKPFP